MWRFGCWTINSSFISVSCLLCCIRLPTQPHYLSVGSLSFLLLLVSIFLLFWYCSFSVILKFPSLRRFKTCPNKTLSNLIQVDSGSDQRPSWVPSNLIILWLHISVYNGQLNRKQDLGWAVCLAAGYYPWNLYSATQLCSIFSWLAFFCIEVLLTFFSFATNACCYFVDIEMKSGCTQIPCIAVVLAIWRHFICSDLLFSANDSQFPWTPLLLIRDPLTFSRLFPDITVLTLLCLLFPFFIPCKRKRKELMNSDPNPLRARVIKTHITPYLSASAISHSTFSPK